MTPAEMIDLFRSHLDTNSNFFGGAVVMHHLDMAQDEIIRQIVRTNPSFYLQSYTVSLVSGQSTYDLPLNAGLGARVVFVENLKTDSDDVRVPPVGFRESFFLEQPSLLSGISGINVTLQGDQLKVVPQPTSDVSDAFKVWYIPQYGHMIQGVPTAAGSTTITLWETPNYTLNFGTPDGRDDYYSAMEFRVVSGTGVGQSRTVSDYDGATRVLTLDSALTTSLETSGEDASHIALMCPVPEQFHPMVPMRAALMGAPRNRNRQGDLEREYYGVPGVRPGLLQDLLNWVALRNADRTLRVEPVDYGDY